MSLLCCLDTALDTAPRVYGCIGGKSSFKDLVPTDNLASLAVEELLGMVDYKTLQVHLGTVLLIALDAQFLDACLTFGALLPLCLGTLVTSYMNVLRREYFDYLAQDIFYELEGRVVAGAEHIVRYSPHLPHFVRAACATIFGICGKCSLHMSGKVNLRNYRYMAICSVLYNLAALFLSVEERTVVLAVILAAVAPYDGLIALCCNGCELWVLLYFDTPALVVGYVPVEAVEVMQRKHVDEAFDRVHGEEVARYVKVCAAVRESWIVGNCRCRQCHLCGIAYRQRLV